jgi:hypothetical protein
MRNNFLFFFIIFQIIGLQCSKDNNPFENYSNAQVNILSDSCSFAPSGDTALIFSTETLAVYTTVREKISSFSIHAGGNRYWHDTTVLPPLKKETYLFLLSYNDTGKKTVSIITHRTNGDDDTTSSDISLLVKSPLQQKGIVKNYGERCTLSTPTVRDRDVYYFWSFISDTVKSPFGNNTDVYPVITVFTKQTGLLWIADTSGKYKSLAVSFSFQFRRP